MTLRSTCITPGGVGTRCEFLHLQRAADLV